MLAGHGQDLTKITSAFASQRQIASSIRAIALLVSVWKMPLRHAD
jgi:hypothetical protein